MLNDKLPLSFGTLLRQFRERTIDRRQGKHLSQESLARKLSDKVGIIFNRNNIGSWEMDKGLVSFEDRRTLIALVAILTEFEGIRTPEDANHLLLAGNYRELNASEKEEIHRWVTRKGISTSPFSTVEQPFRSTNSGLDEEKGSPSETLAVLFGRFPRLQSWLTAASHPVSQVELYARECGDTPIDLGSQRLSISSSFGSYFAGLLEKPNLYLEIDSQIDCPIPRQQAGLSALQRIFWLLEYARGPRTIIIGGEGGMGKSTLSAKIIRCLHQEQAIDLILGDSAKGEHMDPLTRKIIRYKPGYYDLNSFYARLCSQLGLPELEGRQAIHAIRDRLLGRKAIIVLDNLETVQNGDELLVSLKALTSRDIRAIVTTRKIHGIQSLDSERVVVQLQPLTEPQTVEGFLDWHINQHQYQHPALRSLQPEISQHCGWLIERTGGIPLLLQLILSDAARFSWTYVQALPSLYGKELLNHLYQVRWNDLGNLGKPGSTARELLRWIAQEQYKGLIITSNILGEWAAAHNLSPYLSDAISILFEMFLITNRDSRLGNFSIYPSLVEFVEEQELR